MLRRFEQSKIQSSWHPAGRMRLLYSYVANDCHTVTPQPHVCFFRHPRPFQPESLTVCNEFTPPWQLAEAPTLTRRVLFQLTLLTELREIVSPADQLQFDQMVYHSDRRRLLDHSVGICRNQRTLLDHSVGRYSRDRRLLLDHVGIAGTNGHCWTIR